MDISNHSESQEAMANRKYIHWQADGVEKIPPNEAEDIQAVADQINAMQKAQYNMHRHCYTGMRYPIKEIMGALTGSQVPMPVHKVSSKAFWLLKMICRSI